MAIGQGKGTVLAFPGFVGMCVKDIAETGATVDMLDATCMTSTVMEKIGNELVDTGGVTVEVLHDPAIDVRALVGTTGDLTIDNLSEGEAVLTSYAAKAPVKELMSATVTFEYTGQAVTP